MSDIFSAMSAIHRLPLTALIAVGLRIAWPHAQAPAAAPPGTAVRPVVDTYQGVRVTDPYRWLERWDDPEVKAWTDAQNAYTHAQLDALPFMAALRARV